MSSEGKSFTKSDITKAAAAALLLISLIFIVSPAGMLWPLGTWIFLVFGCAGFYFFNAFLIATSIVLLIKGGLIKDYYSWKQFVGFALILIGVSTLSSSIALHNVDDALSAIAEYAARGKAINYYVDGKIGGGYLGYGLAKILDVGGLNFILSIAVLLGGITLFFLPEIISLVAILSGNAKHKFAIRKSQKAVEAEQNNYDEIDDLEFKPIHFGESIENRSTRIELYSEHADPNNFHDEVSDEMPHESYQSGGIHEAKFGEDEDLKPADQYATEIFSANDFFGNQPAVEQKVIDQRKPEVAYQERPCTQTNTASVNQSETQTGVSKAPVYQDLSPSYQKAMGNSIEEEAVHIETVQEEPEFIEASNLYKENNTETVESNQETIVENEEVPSPEVAQSQAVSPVEKELTQSEKLDAKLSLMSPENQYIIRNLHCDLAEELPPYELPPSTLLREPQNTSSFDGMTGDCEAKRAIIDELFQDMHIGAHVEDYVIGPSVTRFNIATEKSVRVSSINGVLPDLAKRLGGIMPRFQDVVMGSQYSGLEIPNVKSDTVYFKEMLDACGYGEKYKFDIPFGKDIGGKYIHGDLRKFPHMLVAGSTGSGKSIFIHGIIMSLIMKNRPEELKLILVDPKRVEMALYKDLPHLLCPIIKDVTQVKVCLDKLIDEMERRNQVFEQAGCTNISQFNDDYCPENGIKKLPYIVLILDEFADAVDVCKNISEPVARLAQKARSAGIHIVLTTQRPTVDVVNGRIKANLPTTVALWVRSATDSCTILNEGGAENLAGHGDMLVNCPELNKYALIRCQGCMVWTDEIKNVCNFIRNQQKTHYDPVFLDLIDHEAEQKAFEEAAAAAMPSHAELRAAEGASKYEMIKEAVMSMEYVSISKIQREFSVGFPRAGKIFKQLQDEGIVAPNEPGQETNSKGSKVLIHAKQELDGENEGTKNGTKVIPNGWDMPK